ncbi:MAG: heparan-alpha-glucosaminide N-acetyltransferase domain-containing protein [Ignavibacteriales bacterium]|nr:heparan-alpha-glucosaminide N-acetyltransferase domain-containing protein [Ignavibacteriales bacterium]
MISSQPLLPQRLTSLDAFRGFAVAGMLLVNNPGTWDPAIVPRLLLHAEWHGCTFADLIFPFFLFAVGMAMPYSEAKKREHGVSVWRGILIAARRALLLYLLGAFLKSASINMPGLHFGILQRIGVLYFIVYLLLPLKVRWQASIGVTLLFVWWAILAFVHGPGVIPGSFDRDVNSAQWLDSFILVPEDKETIISMIPGISTVLAGVLLGRFLMRQANQKSVMRVLALAGVAGIGLGLLWDLVVPLNKILWTASFVVFTAGWSCLVFLLFYWIIEVRKMSKLAFPLIVYGMNAITLYVFTGLFVRWVMLSWKVPYNGTMTSLTGYFYKSFAAVAGPTIGSILYSTMIIFIGWLLCFWMYRRKLFLKV